jgi:hypothetical protein
MPRYFVQNRATKESFEVEAPFAQDACQRLGWRIGDCFVKLLEERPFSDISQKPEKACPFCGWPEPYHDGDRCLKK